MSDPTFSASVLGATLGGHWAWSNIRKGKVTVTETVEPVVWNSATK